MFKRREDWDNRGGINGERKVGMVVLVASSGSAGFLATLALIAAVKIVAVGARKKRAHSQSGGGSGAGKAIHACFITVEK